MNDVNIGKVFSELEIIEFSHIGKHREKHYLCRCKCGNEKVINFDNLRKGMTRSCGCLNKKFLTKLNGFKKEHIFKHGMTNTPEYNAWKQMRRRCIDISCKDYKAYGKRGINVCDRWMKSFSNFYNDMGRRPSPKHTIGRIDNDGDYCPENCRWESNIEQQRNKSNTLFYLYKGEKRTIGEIADDIGVSYKSLYEKIRRRGMSIDQCIQSYQQS